MDNDAELLVKLEQQEASLQFDRFDSKTALSLGLAIIDAATVRAQAVTINVTVNGKVLFHHAMDGASTDQADWVRRKNNVVNRYGHSSYRVGATFRLKGESFDDLAHLDAKDYAAHGGAFPILVRAVGPIGTITVSGLPQAEDHALVIAALESHLNPGH